MLELADWLYTQKTGGKLASVEPSASAEQESSV
jgi:hypothetical protein